MELKPERNYKDRLIRMILMDRKENLLSLYNAVNGTSYTNAEDLVINTLDNAIYMNMKNDMSFIFDFFLNLYEHQATFNPNVPERQILRLSDAFEKPMEEPEVELRVTVLNINPGNNAKLMESCRLLKEYMLYVEKVRKYAKEIPIREAVDRAVAESIQEGILADFLRKNRAEAIEVSIFEYDEEAHMLQVREEGLEEGMEKGELKKLISLVRKKLNKGLSTVAIADMLEEPEPFVEELVKLIEDNPGKTEQELSRIYLDERLEVHA